MRQVGRCVTSALAEADRLAGAGQQARTILFPPRRGRRGRRAGPTVQTLLNAAVGYLTANPTTALSTVYLRGGSTGVRVQGRGPG